MTDDETTGRVEREHSPSPSDVHGGTQVRFHRTLLGLSQETLGEGLGLPFQRRSEPPPRGARVC
jgi:hypothetical protein